MSTEHTPVLPEIVPNAEEVEIQENRRQVEVHPVLSAPEVEGAVTSFFSKIEETIMIPAGNWPEGRTVELSFGWTVVPTLKVRVDQE